MVAMVLTFKWPANSINQAFTGKSMLESLQQYSTQQHAARAKRNWRMVRTLCVEYRRAHRCGALHHYCLVLESLNTSCTISQSEICL